MHAWDRVSRLFYLLFFFFVFGTFQPGKDGKVSGMTNGSGLSDFIKTTPASWRRKERKPQVPILGEWIIADFAESLKERRCWSFVFGYLMKIKGHDSGKRQLGWVSSKNFKVIWILIKFFFFFFLNLLWHLCRQSVAVTKVEGHLQADL